MDTTRPRIW